MGLCGCRRGTKSKKKKKTHTQRARLYSKSVLFFRRAQGSNMKCLCSYRQKQRNRWKQTLWLSWHRQVQIRWDQKPQQSDHFLFFTSINYILLTRYGGDPISQDQQAVLPDLLLQKFFEMAITVEFGSGSKAHSFQLQKANSYQVQCARGVIVLIPRSVSCNKLSVIDKMRVRLRNDMEHVQNSG